MGYENGLITESPISGEDRIIGGEEAGQWEGENGFDVEKWWGYAESIFKWGGSLDDPIDWKQEKPGMQAVPHDQFTVSGSTQLTRKPKGSQINVAEGLIKPGDIVIERARGTAANTNNSYVYVSSGAAKGKQGWIKTMFLTQIRDMGPELDWDPQWYENGESVAANGGVDWVPSGYTGGGQEMTPELIELLRQRREDIERQRLDPRYIPPAPAKKIPVLPIAAIGYFLLNR